MCKSGTHPPYSALSTPGPDTQEQEQRDWQSQVAQRGQVGGRRPRAPGLEATPATPAAPPPLLPPPPPPREAETAGALAVFVQVTDTSEEVIVPARLVTAAWSVSVPLLALV